jgi:hypothetical protein
VIGFQHSLKIGKGDFEIVMPKTCENPLSLTALSNDSKQQTSPLLHAAYPVFPEESYERNYPDSGTTLGMLIFVA